MGTINPINILHSSSAQFLHFNIFCTFHLPRSIRSTISSKNLPSLAATSTISLRIFTLNHSINKLINNHSLNFYLKLTIPSTIYLQTYFTLLHFLIDHTSKLGGMELRLPYGSQTSNFPLTTTINASNQAHPKLL